MQTFRVLVSTNGGLQTIWSTVMADNLGNAYQIAYAQYGKANVLTVMSQ